MFVSTTSNKVHLSLLLVKKQKLNQCLLNIFKNCIEAMPTGGDLVLTLVPEHKHIQLYIKDTGIGMDQEQVKRLGSPFYSTKKKALVLE